MRRHGALRDEDAGELAPAALFRCQRDLEPPDPAEGFTRVDRVPFARQRDPSQVNRAIVTWCDDPATLEGQAAALRAYQDAGWPVLVLSWQPAIAGGQQTPEHVRSMFGTVANRTGLAIDLAFCPHGAGPPRCWCRKPLPGLGVLMIHRHRLDPAQCRYRGHGPQDPGFARKLGFTLDDAAGHPP